MKTKTSHDPVVDLGHPHYNISFSHLLIKLSITTFPNTIIYDILQKCLVELLFIYSHGFNLSLSVYFWKCFQFDCKTFLYTSANYVFFFFFFHL